VLLLGAIVAAACGSSSPTSPTVEPPFSQTDLRVGSGAEAAAGKMVTVHYALWLYDASKPDQKGQMVQTSVGGTPFTFTLGTGAVIRGWDQGCAGMKAGGLRRLVVPSNLAYASMPPPGIPVNATLIFEVELLAVQG
jgi:FKBP-type peptidyl-prolyl cis-trans isomerase